MAVTKDELMSAFLHGGRASFEQDSKLFYNVLIQRVALRRTSDGALKLQADMWNGRNYNGFADETWKEPIRTADLEDIVVVDPPDGLRSAVALSFDRGKHWLTEAMELQLPVTVNNYHLQSSHGWLVQGVTIDRVHGRYVVGAELWHPSCPNSMVSVNPKHLSLECSAQADAS